ncbi:MAG TPA: FAD/NAD(P)-binding oxidoreductase [Mycobacterium sp.]|nr:FAD/NAD(P)-binding oxidoreductase [Mycobacterium sp.]
MTSEASAPERGIVIVGGGLAGVRTAEELRREEYAGPITIVGDENRLPYDRPPLTKEVLRGDRDDTTLEPQEFYDQHRITLRLGSAAQSIDTGARTVTLADQTVLGYDQLVIATGLRPRRIPTFPVLEGIRVIRSFGESLELRAHAATAKRAVVIGAGFIGCEVAASLRRLGLEVVLVEPQPTPLASVLGEQIGELVARLHRANGVDVRTGVGVADVLARSDDRHVDTVVLTDGTEVAADLVLVGIGSEPATGWLAGSGIEVDPVDRGIACDELGHTGTPNVWALGDVAFWHRPLGRQVRVEHWSNVVTQVRVMVPAMLGRGSLPDVVVPPYIWSDQYDVKFQCLGEPEVTDKVHLVTDDGHKFLAYYERDGVLVAVVGAGMPGKVMATRGKIAAGASISDVLG